MLCVMDVLSMFSCFLLFPSLLTLSFLKTCVLLFCRHLIWKSHPLLSFMNNEQIFIDESNRISKNNAFLHLAFGPVTRNKNITLSITMLSASSLSTRQDKAVHKPTFLYFSGWKPSLQHEDCIYRLVASFSREYWRG